MNHLKNDKKGKKEIISIGKINNIVPKEHLNFDKNVIVPKVEPNKTYVDYRNGRIIKATYPKNYNGNEKKNVVQNEKQEIKKETKKEINVNQSNNVKNENNVVNTTVKETIGVITGTEVRFRQEGSLNGKVLGYEMVSLK